MTENQILGAGLIAGACALLLLMVIWAVVRPAWRRWRYRRAIEYRTLVTALQLRWPGFPGCICFPGDAKRTLAGLPPCAARKHRK
ncbi:MAG: hypothetical protein AB7P99_16460 [Vicinamibacterales bacterium]